MKGKKFDAAEKHFHEKEVKLRKLISELEKEVSEKADALAEATKKLSALENENAQLKEWIDRLLQYTELSKEDIKEACEKDKKMSGLLDLFGLVRKGGYI